MWHPSKSLVTIGVPVYNGELYLREALDSLLGQTYGDFGLVISDNASTDGTESICREYAARDRRVRYERSPRNVGVSRNHQRILDFCTTPYFRWAADDDLSAPTSLERCLAVLESRPDVVLAYPKTRLIDAAGTVTGEYEDHLHLVQHCPSDRYITLANNLGLCNAIFGLARTDVLRRVGPMGPYAGSDIVFLAELSLHGCFWEVPEFLFYRRMHPEAASAMTEEQLLVHCDPTARRRDQRLWRHLVEHLRAAIRAPIHPREKARVVGFLLRGAVGNRDRHVEELLSALREYAGGGDRDRSSPGADAGAARPATGDAGIR